MHGQIREAFPDLAISIGVVAYRDHTGAGERIESLPFQSSISAVKVFLAGLKPIGGDDDAEDVLGGIEEATMWVETSEAPLEPTDPSCGFLTTVVPNVMAQDGLGCAGPGQHPHHDPPGRLALPRHCLPRWRVRQLPGRRPAWSRLAHVGPT